MEILHVVGTRPHFMKLAPVHRALEAAGLRSVILHTGQHYDAALSAAFFEDLELPAPRERLEVGSGTHGVQTARMLAGVEAYLLAQPPAAVLVYGDTNSSLAAALSAAKLRVPLAHVEAGLRSFNRDMPEELNRILIDHASDLLFPPTETAEAHLAREGIPPERVVRVGDVMLDAARQFTARAREHSDVLERLGLTPGGYLLATVHRAENTDAPSRLTAILNGLSELAAELPVVLPLHPRTRRALEERGELAAATAALTLTEPAGYLDMLWLEHHARAIATDSGGVQKEAFFQGVPCATLRDETEWVELVELGWNRLVPPSSAAAVVAGVRDALESGPGRPAAPYGHGDAAARIVEALRTHLESR